MIAKTRFRGSFTALVTPFKNGSVDEKAFRDLVDWQFAEGTNGLVPVGTTGESPTCSASETGDILRRRQETGAGAEIEIGEGPAVPVAVGMSARPQP